MIINPYAFGAGSIPTESYYDLVLASSPIRYYRMNDVSGTLVDTVGSSPMALYSGVPLYRQDPITSKLEPSIYLNGSSSFSAGYTSLTGAISVEYWMNFEGGSTTGNPFSWGYNSGFRMQVNATFVDIVYSYAGQTVVSPIDMTGPKHVVGTAGPAGSSIYVNGVLVGSNTTLWPGANSFSYIGMQDLSTEYFKGRLSDMAVYNRVLMDAEILAHYNAGH